MLHICHAELDSASHESLNQVQNNETLSNRRESKCRYKLTEQGFDSAQPASSEVGLKFLICSGGI